MASGSNGGRPHGGTSASEQAFRQLCHVLSLDRTGKVKGAIDQLVLSVLCIDPKLGRGGDPNEAATAISTYFGLTIDVGAVREAIEVHLKAGRLAIDRTSTPNRVGLSLSARAEVQGKIEKAQELEEKVRADWLGQLPSRCDDIDHGALWSALQSYAGSVFRQHGAETVQLLDASVKDPSKAGLPAMMRKAIQDAGLQNRREDASAAITMFFSTQDASRVQYLSELLDGTFTFFALTVSDATAEFLKTQIPPLQLFLDTNVVLGLLGFQDNPLQDAAAELMENIKANKYPFKIYCHERTLKELQEVIDAAGTNLKARHFSPALSRAYLQWGRTNGASGIETKFHTMNSENPTDVETYLARFDHLNELLDDAGIKIYRQGPPELDTTVKGEHVAQFEHFLKSARAGRPPRRYPAMDHDVVVWMSLQRKRHKASSALRTGALFLSNDRALQAFDKRHLMRKKDGHGVPTVVLPQHLLQVLRPFGNVETDFDNKFMAIFAAPEFRTVQTDYDETVAKVMRVLASFEDISTDTAVNILSDKLLVNRLKDTEDEKFGEMIEAAVLQKNEDLLKGITEMQTKMEETNQILADRFREITEERERADRLAEEAAEKEAAARKAAELEAEAESRAETAVSDVEKLKAEVADAKAKQTRIEADRDKAQERLDLVKRIAVVAPLALLGMVVCLIGPQIAGWDSFMAKEKHYSVQILAAVAWAGLMYCAGFSKYRSWVLGTVVLAALFSIAQLL